MFVICGWNLNNAGNITTIIDKQKSYICVS